MEQCLSLFLSGPLLLQENKQHISVCCYISDSVQAKGSITFQDYISKSILIHEKKTWINNVEQWQFGLCQCESAYNSRVVYFFLMLLDELGHKVICLTRLICLQMMSRKNLCAPWFPLQNNLCDYCLHQVCICQFSVIESA